MKECKRLIFIISIHNLNRKCLQENRLSEKEYELYTIFIKYVDENKNITFGEKIFKL